jgi:hypothetical protein
MGRALLQARSRTLAAQNPQLIPRKRCARLRQAAWIASALASITPSACSPYVYSDNVQTLTSKMGSIDSSYQENTQKIVAERHLTDRTLWIHNKPALASGPGCDADAPNIVPCDLVVRSTAVPAVKPLDPPAKPPPIASTDICEPTTGDTSFPTTDTVKNLPPLQRAQLLRALDHYTAGLAAVTKAQDRADFDDAAAKVSAGVGSLAQTAATASGVGAAAAPAVGAVAKASSNAILWLVGQDLDHRRLEQLQIATREACKPIHMLAFALAVILEEQRGNRLDGLLDLLSAKIQALNTARVTPRVTDQNYGASIDDAVAAADAFQTVRAVDPRATAQALSDAHDKLVVAVRNDDGQFAALVASLQNFAQRASDLASAAAATGANPAGKKS